MKALIFEDDLPHLATAIEALGRLGFATCGYPNARAAVHHCSHIRPDVVLIDLVMADGPEGIETIQALKQMGQPFKIVAMSGHPDYLTYAAGLGADAVVNKPLSVDKLTRALTDLNLM